MTGWRLAFCLRMLCLACVSSPAESAELQRTPNMVLQQSSSASKGGRIGYVGMVIDGNQVKEVIPNSPAAKARILKGDLIISVNNYPASALKGDSLVKTIHGVVGTSVSLVIRRGGKEYSCSLVRAEASLSNSRSPNFAGVEDTNEEAASGASSTRSFPAVKPDSADLEMISIFRKSADTQPAYNRVLDALHRIPLSRRTELSKWGLKLVIAPTIVDAHPQFATERPRGYLHGGTYQNCPGLYGPGDKTIYVAEKASIGNSPFQQNVWIRGTVLHEFGHALDHYESRSTSPEFRKAYQEDSNRLTNELRNKFYYYTQADDAGPSELFAELYSEARGAGESEGLENAFPHCFKYIKQMD